MISVIIPVYNTERYLCRCLNSILSSTCQDFEIILIDDGSTDHSPEICRNYRNADNRVKFLHQDNRGVSAARNRGIEESQGEWIVFVDSDDFISSDFFDIIVQRKFQDQELLIFDYETIKSGGKTGRYKSFSQKLPELYYSKRDAIQIIEKMLYSQQLIKKGNTNLRSPWAKAYRKTFIDRYNLRFSPELFIGEDKLFNIEYQFRAESFVYIPETVYFAQWRPDSATHCYQQNIIRNNKIFQIKLKALMKRHRFFDALEKAYYENVLATMTEVLVYGIFDPRRAGTHREKCKLCEEVHAEPFFQQAMKYNKKTGNILRKVLLILFYFRFYRVVDLICKLSYVTLRIIRK